MTPLPPGWVEYFTLDDHFPYYYNTFTKETIWERPTVEEDEVIHLKEVSTPNIPIVTSTPPPSIPPKKDIHCGYLYKKGKIRTWKKRYFVLEGSKFEYYDSEAGFKSGTSKCAGSIDIKSATCSPVVGKYLNCFQITTSSRVMILKTDTPREFNKWKDEFKNSGAIWEGRVSSIIMQDETVNTFNEPRAPPRLSNAATFKMTKSFSFPSVKEIGNPVLVTSSNLLVQKTIQKKKPLPPPPPGVVVRNNNSAPSLQKTTTNNSPLIPVRRVTALPPPVKQSDFKRGLYPLSLDTILPPPNNRYEDTNGYNSNPQRPKRNCTVCGAEWNNTKFCGICGESYNYL